MNTPSVKQILSSARVPVAEGVEVWRPFPVRGLKQIGPFLLWDHFGPKQVQAGEQMTVPAHPHAGFQAVTYLFSGIGRHRDSLGADAELFPGGINWMTAGKGIVHMEEVFGDRREEGGVYEGFQIWVNLPASAKYVDPKFDYFPAESLPGLELADGKASVRVLAGSWGDTQSPVPTYSPLVLYHLSLEAGAELEIPLDPDFEMALYVAKGSSLIEGAEGVKETQLALLHSQNKGITLQAESALEALVFGGVPLQEPVASYGPFVMNKPEEIHEVIAAYRRGEMGEL